MRPSLRRRPAAKIALILGLLGLLWIGGSDYLVHSLLPPELWPEAQTVKGSVFILGGAGIAYLLVRAFQHEIEGVVKRLERAESLARIGGWELDSESEDLEWTRQVYRIFGVSPDRFEPSWEGFLSFVHPEDRSELRAAREAALAGRGPVDVEHRIVRNDGEVLWVHERAELIEDDGPRLSGTVEDVTERKQLEEALRHRALHDPLTDLPNRSRFEDRLDAAFSGADGTGEPLAVLMLDLVRFRDINDSLGHRAGDRVLQQVAHRLEESVREGDAVARVGGDEFAVLLEEVEGVAGAQDALARIEGAFDEAMTVEGESVRLELRVGAALHSPEAEAFGVRAGHPQELVRAADLAMHRAREKGEHHFYSPDENGKIAGRLRRVQRLRKAIESGEVEPFYQPLVELETGDVWGVEPLARWRHPERGIVPPGEFIPLAEEAGLIGDLGASVLRQACRRVAEWNRDGVTDSPLCVSANLSARQVDDEGLAATVEEILRETGLRPGRCQFEITETAILGAGAGVDVLRALGARLAIDDFGTGYASFTYLRNLDVDALKIDLSFVQGVAADEEDRAICRTVVGLADAFGLSVIAEGIETEEQRSELLEMGCPRGQGYLFGRPRPAGEARELVAGGTLRAVS